MPHLDPEAKKAYDRAYHQKNKHRWPKPAPEVKRARGREWYKKYSDRIKQERKARYAAKRGEILAQMKEYRAKNPDKIRERNRKQRAKHPPQYWVAKERLRLYGITEIQYQDQHQIQQGGCALCGVQSRSLAVDHDHATGAIRGLLCGSCNGGLGLFKDNQAVLLKAIEYLKSGGVWQTNR